VYLKGYFSVMSNNGCQLCYKVINIATFNFFSLEVVWKATLLFAKCMKLRPSCNIYIYIYIYTLTKFFTFIPGHLVYIYIYLFIYLWCMHIYIHCKSCEVDHRISRPPVTAGHTFMEPANSYSIHGHYTITWPPVHLESWTNFRI
jgi:hypothetical protein